MRYLKNMKVSSKVFTIMLGGLFLILLITIPLLQYQMSGIKQATLDEQSGFFRKTIEQSLDAKKNVWLTNALQIANNPIIINSVKNGDRQRIIDMLAHYGKVFKENTGFKNVQVHIIDKNLNSFVKSWAPDSFGESLNYSPAYKKVKTAVTAEIAMETSPKGLRLKGLFPILINSEFAGLANFEGGLNSIKRDLKAQHMDFLYLLDNSRLHIAKDLKGKPQIGNYTLSQKDVDDEFFSYASKELNLSEALKNYCIDTRYLTVAEPVLDINGKTIGVFILGQKIDRVLESVNKNKKLVWNSFVLICSAFAIMIFFVTFFLNRYTVNPISAIVKTLTGNSKEVALAADQIATSSQSLADGASEQASSLEQTSSSLEQITAQTHQTVENFQQADAAVRKTAEMVDKGVFSMEKMNSAINEIKESSNETSKIIKTIDDIAFQTNLLALNAAVEAARAGEAGKGFAVVAEEVRNLAQRSAEAAQNTSQLIEKSQENANNGVAVAEEVTTQLNSIKDSAGKINTLISEIAAASREQTQGIEQINVAVSEMDKVVQQNAADSEESASAAEELSAQATEMEKMVAALEAVVAGASEKNKGSKNLHQVSSVKKYQQKKTLNQPAQKRQNPKKLAPKAQKSHAEQVIPLDDDDFKDF
jgi:methyl-accepting chemotaxis protein